jgi:hypothetical protein
VSNPVKSIFKDINNTTTTQLVKLNQQAIKLTVGDGNGNSREIVNMRNLQEREAYFKKVRKANAVPNTLNGIINTLRLVNSYDLCNPFTFAVSKVFPPEGAVGTEVRKITEFIRGIQSALRGVTLIGGNVEAKGFSQDGQEFVSSGNIILDIEGVAKPKKGATVYITQTDNPKIGSQMVGTVEGILDEPFEEPETV